MYRLFALDDTDGTGRPDDKSTSDEVADVIDRWCAIGSADMRCEVEFVRDMPGRTALAGVEGSDGGCTRGTGGVLTLRPLFGRPGVWWSVECGESASEDIELEDAPFLGDMKARRPKNDLRRLQSEATSAIRHARRHLSMTYPFLSSMISDD